MFVVNGPIGQIGPTISTSSSQASFAPDTVSVREAPSDIALPRPIMASDAVGKTSKAVPQKDNASEPERNQSSDIDLIEGAEAQSVFEAIAQPKQDAIQPDVQDIANRYIEAISSQVQPKPTAPDPDASGDTPDAILLDSTNPFERANSVLNKIDLRF
ncbi:MAG: hypothetical protein ABJ251_14970 [Paracoccaceae bacterium]